MKIGDRVKVKGWGLFGEILGRTRILLDNRTATVNGHHGRDCVGLTFDDTWIDDTILPLTALDVIVPLKKVVGSTVSDGEVNNAILSILGESMSTDCVVAEVSRFLAPRETNLRQVLRCLTALMEEGFIEGYLDGVFVSFRRG